MYLLVGCYQQQVQSLSIQRLFEYAQSGAVTLHQMDVSKPDRNTMTLH